MCYENGFFAFTCGCRTGYRESAPHAPPTSAHTCTRVTATAAPTVALTATTVYK